MTSVFPTVLKTAKVVPVFKKDTKLNYSNYFQSSMLPDIEKIVEKLMSKRLYTFLNYSNIIYKLQFGQTTLFYISCFRQHKKLNLLIEFSNSIFIKFYLKAFWCCYFVQNTFTNTFTSFRCKKAKIFHELCPVNPNQGFTMNPCGV